MRDLEGLKECLDDKRKDERKDEDAWQRLTSAKTNNRTFCSGQKWAGLFRWALGAHLRMCVNHFLLTSWSLM